MDTYPKGINNHQVFEKDIPELENWQERGEHFYLQKEDTGFSIARFIVLFCFLSKCPKEGHDLRPRVGKKTV